MPENNQKLSVIIKGIKPVQQAFTKDLTGNARLSSSVPDIAGILQRAQLCPLTVSRIEILQLQKVFGNSSVCRFLLSVQKRDGQPVQAKDKNTSNKIAVQTSKTIQMIKRIRLINGKVVDKEDDYVVNAAAGEVDVTDQYQEMLPEELKTSAFLDAGVPGTKRARSVEADVLFERDAFDVVRETLKTVLNSLIQKHMLKKMNTVMDAMYALRKYTGMHDPKSDKEIVEDLPSPYTHDTSIAFFNLAESHIDGVGEYDGESGDSVRACINNIKRAGITDRQILQLLVTPAFTDFNKLFAEYSAAIEAEEVKGKLKKQIWSIIQLWHLEAGRRESAGVMNAILAIRELDKDETDMSAARVIVDRNVMSHEGASGKSMDPSPGKQVRQKKMRQVITGLIEGKLEASGNPYLVEVKRAILEFMKNIRRAKEDQTPEDRGKYGDVDADYAQADMKWQKDAIKGKHKDRMVLGIAKGMTDNVNLAKLKSTQAYRQLAAAFANFMNAYYSGVKASKGPKAADEVVDTGIESLECEPFMVWLIGKAASEGHQRVLDLSKPVSSKEKNEFLASAEANQAPGEASAVKYVSMLRESYGVFTQTPILEKMRINSNNPTKHFDTVFGEYEDLKEDIIDELYYLYGNSQEARTTVESDIRTIMSSGNIRIFDLHLERIMAKKKAYDEWYEGRIAGIMRFARSNAGKRWYSSKFRAIANGAGEIADILIKVNRLDKFSPSNIHSAFVKLKALWRVYNIIEPVRDEEAGGVNFFTSGFARKQSGEELSAEEVYHLLNILSPKQVNSDKEIKTQQYEQLLNYAAFGGEFTQRFVELNLLLKEKGKEHEEVKAFRGKLNEDLAAYIGDCLDDRSGLSEKEEDIGKTKFSEDKMGTKLFGSEKDPRVPFRRLIAERFMLGTSRSTGNNCLIHTLWQLANGRGTGSEEEIRGLRRALVEQGVALQGDMIDLYGMDGHNLLLNFLPPHHFRIQVYQVTNNGDVIEHPVVGTEGEIRYILHRGYHFTPLWLR
jgi:hypothetical protein